MKNQLRGTMFLLITSIIWGTSFVAQSMGLEKIQPFTYNVARGVLATATIFVISLIKDAISRKKGAPITSWRDGRLLKAGIICGLCLAVASTLQQYGLQLTTVGKAGFITVLYIVLVPVMGLFAGKRPAPVVWLCVLLSLSGLYLMCNVESGNINAGDIIITIASVGYSLQIIALAKYAPDMDCYKLSCIQFSVLAVFSVVGMLLFDQPNMADIWSVKGSILYSGVISFGIANTFQAVGQKDTDATLASLIMSLESVFAAVAAFVILGQKMSGRELAGAAMLFVAIVVVQVAPAFTSKRKAAAALRQSAGR